MGNVSNNRLVSMKYMGNEQQIIQITLHVPMLSVLRVVALIICLQSSQWFVLSMKTVNTERQIDINVN